MIEVKSGLPRDVFATDYVRAGRPIILEDFTTGWPKWSADYLKASGGDQMVEVMADRATDPQYEINCAAHKTHMQLSVYLDRIERYEGNDLYLVANNFLSETPVGQRLLAGIPFNGRYLTLPVWPRNVHFWIGPKGTVTLLHHDTVSLVIAQVVGRKRFTMISPEQTPLVYNHVGVFSEVNAEQPDLSRHPLYDRTVRVEFTLHPGQALLIPVGWWHQVRSLDLSMSVSLTGLCS